VKNISEQNQIIPPGAMWEDSTFVPFNKAGTFNRNGKPSKLRTKLVIGEDDDNGDEDESLSARNDHIMNGKDDNVVSSLETALANEM